MLVAYFLTLLRGRLVAGDGEKGGGGRGFLISGLIFNVDLP